MAEAILDLNVEASRAKYAVDEIFQLGSVDVEKLKGGDDFNVGHEGGRVEFVVGDPRGHHASGNAGLV